MSRPSLVSPNLLLYLISLCVCNSHPHVSESDIRAGFFFNPLYFPPLQVSESQIHHFFLFQHFLVGMSRCHSCSGGAVEL